MSILYLRRQKAALGRRTLYLIALAPRVLRRVTGLLVGSDAECPAHVDDGSLSGLLHLDIVRFAPAPASETSIAHRAEQLTVIDECGSLGGDGVVRAAAAAAAAAAASRQGAVCLAISRAAATDRDDTVRLIRSCTLVAADAGPHAGEREEDGDDGGYE